MNYRNIGISIKSNSIIAGVVENLNLQPSIVKTSVTEINSENVSTKEAFVSSILETLKPLLLYNNINKSRIGISIPGPFDYKTGVCKAEHISSFKSIFLMNLKELLVEELKINHQNLILSNDATCFLRGEILLENTNNFNSNLAITLGNGFGTAYQNENIVEDALLWKKKFLNGIAEDYISFKWIKEQVEKKTGQVINDIEDVLLILPNHSTAINNIFDEFSEYLSVLLYDFIRKYQTYEVIIGGSFMKVEHLFHQKIQKKLYNKIGLSVPIHKSLNEEKSCVIGAVDLMTNA